ncbi:hypothetical protein BDR04DRAFT_1097186 [Suillus decipiens]|nr:hypothetical protein BDR04DRAFT_1097186 [Suillus decipiens]
MALGWGLSCQTCRESKAVLPMQRPSVKRCNLPVRTFETLGKLHNNYSYHVHLLLANQSVENMHICTLRTMVALTRTWQWISTQISHGHLL